MDWNKDRINCKNVDNHGKNEIEKVMFDFGLEDVFRRRYPHLNSYTWRGKDKASRLDFWLVAKSIDCKVMGVFKKVCPFLIMMLYAYL